MKYWLTILLTAFACGWLAGLVWLGLGGCRQRPANRPEYRSEGFALLAVLAVLAVIAAGAYVLAPVDAGGHRRIAPSTWFSHRPADKVDQSQRQLAAAQTGVARAEEDKEAAALKILHAAHLETHQADQALTFAPAGPAVKEAGERLDAALKLEGEIDPLSYAEMSADLTLMRSRLGTDAARLASANAEIARQEAANGALSRDLGLAQATVAAREADAATAREKVTMAEKGLRSAFDRENALADDYRNLMFVKKLLIVGVIFFCLLCLYLHSGLKGSGAVLHELVKGQAPAEQARITTAFDGELDKLQQNIVKTGKAAAAAAESKAKSVLGLPS